jgi:hypothetical protein
LGKTQRKEENMSANIYSINLVFTTDRPISEAELDTLQSQVMAQIEEPVDSNGADVDYITTIIGGNK